MKLRFGEVTCVKEVKEVTMGGECSPDAEDNKHTQDFGGETLRRPKIRWITLR
jgi:hypothetical protein